MSKVVMKELLREIRTFREILLRLERILVASLKYEERKKGGG